MPYQWKVRFEGRGQGLNEYGILRVIDGRLLLCDGDLTAYVSQWEGKLLEVGFWLSEDSPELPPDPLVWPLVEALQARGVRTLSSCQGHMEPDKSHRPYVSFYSDDKPKVEVAPGWEVLPVPPDGSKVSQLRTRTEAGTEEELIRLQEMLGLQTDVLKALG